MLYFASISLKMYLAPGSLPRIPLKGLYLQHPQTPRPAALGGIRVGGGGGVGYAKPSFFGKSRQKN